MISRLVPILSLLVMVALMFYLWQSGTLGQIFRPSVMTLVMKTDGRPGDPVSESNVVAREIAAGSMPGGAIFFKKGTKPEDAFAVISKVELRNPVKKDAVLLVKDLQQSRRLFGIRTQRPVKAGERVDFSTMSTFQVSFDAASGVYAIDPGSIVFADISKAQAFVAATPTLKFSREIGAGASITAADLDSGDMRRMVLKARNSMRGGTHLGGDTFTPEMAELDTLGAGVAVFPGEAEAKAFVAGLGNFSAASDIRRGSMLGAGMLMPVPPAERSVVANPRTLAELDALEAARPDEVIRLAAVGAALQEEGAPVDIWVETRRTSGETFGAIDLQRIAAQVPLRMVEEDMVVRPDGTEVPLADIETAEAQAGTESGMPANAGAPVPASVDLVGETDILDMEQTTRSHFWLKAPAEIKQAMDRIASGDGLVLIVPSDARMADLIGNGAVCTENRCSVNRGASNDLGDLQETIEAIGAQME